MEEKRELWILDDLNEEEYRKNRSAIDVMIRDQWYEFSGPVKAIPYERMTPGHRNFGKSIQFKKAKYGFWNEKGKEHIFMVPKINRPNKWFMVGIFLCGGVTCTSINEPLDPHSPC